MATLSKHWKFGKNLGVKNLWLLTRTGDAPPNVAYIPEPAPCGTRELYVWNGQTPEWEFHCESKNLRALKAIGRMEAARRLNV